MSDEREAKLVVDDDFEVPVLDDVIPGAQWIDLPAQRLIATYYDTETLSLAGAGVTLRHRVGEVPERWTVKLPGSPSGSVLSRGEHTFEGSRAAPPDGATDLVRALTRGRSLEPVARVRASRVGWTLTDPNGVAILEMTDDRVAASVRGTEVIRFRELEVEHKGPEASELDVVDSVVDCLVDAGASRTDPQSKFVRALGAAGLSPRPATTTTLDKESPARDFVTHIFAESIQNLLTTDPRLRLDARAEDVHVYRVATRRLRSDLRTLRPLLDRECVVVLRAELKWLADVVGDVRDADVLGLSLRARSAALPEADTIGIDLLIDRAVAQRDAARVQMMAALRSARYDALTELLVSTALQPPFDADADVDAPARRVVKRLVRRSWDQLRREVAKAGPRPSDDSLHRIRIAAKRTRYAAEAAAHVWGKQASRFAKAISEAQTVLGDHHDSSVTEAWVRRVAATTPGDLTAGVTAGLLIASTRRDRETLAKQWRTVWRRASAPKLRSWF